MDGCDVEFGTEAWLQVVEEEAHNGMHRNPPPSDFRVSFIERFHGAPPLPDGSMLGFRIDVNGRNLFFRGGVGPSEDADVVIDADVDAVRVLTGMLKTDPLYGQVMQHFVDENKFRVKGDSAKVGDWLNGCHDAIVARTRQTA